MANIKKFESSVIKQLDLSGKNVLITGGAGFLGEYFAEAVSEMGGFPILLDLIQEDLDGRKAHLLKKNISCDVFRLNIASCEEVTDVVTCIEEKYDHLDVLINGAAFAMKSLVQGGASFFAPFEDYEKELWEVSLNVNLTGTFLVTQSVGRRMKAQKKGSIINIASDVAVISPDHRIYEPDERSGYAGVDFNTPLSYSVTKSGILSLTRYLATYWARDGIRVNSISPAGVYRSQPPAFVQQLSSRIPLGRMACPEELKGVIVLLSSEASSYMTGANIIVDGGRTVW